MRPVIFYTDAPYRFQPSRYDPLMSTAIAAWVRCAHLPLRVGVRPIHVEPTWRERHRFTGDDRVMVLANHTSLTDGSVMVDVLRRRGLHPCFLSTYEMFLRPGIIRWSLRRLGAMSIQPNGSDFQGMQEAIRILTRHSRGRLKPSLCVFPEGVIYRDMDRVHEFEEGAFALAFRAAWEMRDQKRVHIQPVAIHVSHTDPEGTKARVLDRMGEVESLLEVKPKPGDPIRRRIVRAGRAYVGAAARRLDLTPRHRDVRRALAEVQREGVEALIAELGPTPRKRPCRSEQLVRAIGLFHERNREGKQASADTRRWADRLTVLRRLERFDPQHLNRRLTFNQVAGIIETFMEDLGGALPRPLGPREVFVSFCDPVCVSDGIDRAAPSEVIASARRRVTEAINARLHDWHERKVSPGDQPWRD